MLLELLGTVDWLDELVDATVKWMLLEPLDGTVEWLDELVEGTVD